MHMHAVSGKGIQDLLGKALIQEGQQPGEHLIDVDVHAALRHLLRHFQADKAAADNGGPSLSLSLNCGFEKDAVLHCTQIVDTLRVHTGDVRPDGTGAGGDDQLVVGAHSLRPGIQILYGHGFCGGIDSCYLMVDVGGDAPRVCDLVHRQTH